MNKDVYDKDLDSLASQPKPDAFCQQPAWWKCSFIYTITQSGLGVNVVVW